MNCPYCNGKTMVVDSRPNEESVHRRRECLECKHRFNTEEIDTELYEKLTSPLTPIVRKCEEAIKAFTSQMQEIIKEMESKQK